MARLLRITGFAGVSYGAWYLILNGEPVRGAVIFAGLVLAVAGMAMDEG